jgi:hypothetical protein
MGPYMPIGSAYLYGPTWAGPSLMCYVSMGCSSRLSQMYYMPCESIMSIKGAQIILHAFEEECHKCENMLRSALNEAE